jgi:hypothetical protein
MVMKPIGSGVLECGHVEGWKEERGDVGCELLNDSHQGRIQVLMTKF